MGVRAVCKILWRLSLISSLCSSCECKCNNLLFLCSRYKVAKTLGIIIMLKFIHGSNMMQFAPLVNTLNNTSVVVKSSILAVILSYLVGLIPGAYSALSITPSLLLPPNFRLWTLVTGLLVEGSFFNVIIDIPVLIACGLYIEPLWGALEFLKYIAVTGFGSALLTSFVSLAVYAVSHNYSLWFIQFSGIAGVIGGISVAFKQIKPDQKINLQVQVLRLHDAPLISILLFTFFSVVRLISYTQPIMVMCGIMTGWVYLRFYQRHGKGVRGDMNEAMEAATLVPPLLRPPVRMLSSTLFHILVSVGLCKNPVRTYDVGAPSSITISLPGSDPVDAERRRKKALRALNERLNKMQKKSTPDEMDDDDEGWPTIGDELKQNELTTTDRDDVTTDRSVTSLDSDSVTTTGNDTS